MVDRRLGPRDRRLSEMTAEERAYLAQLNQEVFWDILKDLTGETDHQMIREIVLSWVRFYQAAHQSKLAAIRWVWTFAAVGTAGLFTLWLQEKAPALASTLRKLGLMP